MQNLREAFPYFQSNPNAVYLDSASSTQKPGAVLDAVNDFYRNYYANAGRGSYTAANQVTAKIAEVRRKAAAFINAASEREVVFTSGATESLNLVAYAWGLNNLRDGDEVIVSQEEHKSAVLPWLRLQEVLRTCGKEIRLAFYSFNQVGEADVNEIASLVTARTRLVSVPHIHNVYGTKTDVLELRKRIGRDVIISLDATQSVSHAPVDVQALEVDFLSFSSHKLFGSNGTGVLYVNQRLHHAIRPLLVGGGDALSMAGGSLVITGSMPHILEPGTANLAGIIGLGASLDFVTAIGVHEMGKHIQELGRGLFHALKELPGIEFLPGMAFCPDNTNYGIISFKFPDVDSGDIGFVLNEHGICVRTGNHCVSGRNSTENSVRVSLHAYNDKADVDRLVGVLGRLR